MRAGGGDKDGTLRGSLSPARHAARAGGPPDLSQGCCALEGITQLLSFVPGDFAVVLHSEPDCANLVYSDSRAVDPARFFCTNLREVDAIAGRSRVRLAAAVREAVDRRGPSTIFVVGGCVAGLIDDDVEEIVSSLEMPRGVRVIALDGGAFKKHGQASVIDRFTGLMAEAARPGRPRGPRTVNLVGFPTDGGEASEILGRAGIAINAWPQLSSPQEAWAALPAAALTVVSDAALFVRLSDVARSWRGHRLIELDPPFGVAACDRFYLGLAEHVGRVTAMRAALKARHDRAARTVARAARGFRGLRLAYHVGGRKDFELHTLVRGGLAFVSLFAEMGFAIELMFQGAVEEAQRTRIAALLAHYGVTAPFICLPDRVSLTRALRDAAHDLVYCSDSLREEAGTAGVPVLPAGSLSPGYAGTALDCARIEALLG